MTLIRRLILALALSAGLSPVFAQAPPPVPALPDAERRTSFTISGTTCACAVGFALYGDSTDYQNWVEVFVNGVRVNFNDSTFGWTITSPTGALASIPRPVTDAVLTFTNAQTGTIQVVGARRPRRTSTFAENRGVAARDLNQILNDMIAQTREVWDKTNDVTGRAIMGIPGEAIIPLPSAALRANSVLCWDATGLIPKACAPLTGLGNVIGPNSAVNGHIAIFSGTTGTIITDGGLVGTGNVTGPGSATDGAFALYNGITGALIKNGPTIIPLASGGTAAALTASNGGLVYSTGAALAILSGTATANQIAMSGSSTTPAWSTATYPATTTANQLLWSSGTNAIAGLATANNGTLITSAGGVPSISSTLPAAVQANITALGTIVSGAWNGTLIGTGFGGTNCSTPTGTCLDNITGFASTGYLKRTGAGAYSFNNPIPLADGGTNASLSASNGGLFYSTGSAAAILSGTGSANQIPLSGINSAPAWSTSTWPNTVSANSLLWSAGSNAVSGLATGNNGVLVTSGLGVPSISSTLPTAVQSNITQLGTIGAGVWNGTAITGSFIGTNTVTNSNLAQASLGATLKGNPTASGANVQDFTIQGLTNKPSPNANNDFILLFDATSGAFRSVTPGQLVSGTTAGVSTLNGLSGALSIAQGTRITVAASGSAVTVNAAFPPGFWSGCKHSNDVGTPNTKIDIAACTTRDSTDAINIVTTACVIDATTVGANGLDAGSLTATGWFYTFTITTAASSTACLASTSPTAPTLPATFTQFRRVGAFRTDGSSHILAFTQVNDEWWWTVSIRDASGATINTTPALYTLSVPRVQGVAAIINAFYFQTTVASTGAAFRPGFAPAVSVTQDGFSVIQNVANLGASGQFRIQVDSSGRISAVADQATGAIINLWTNGWRDPL